MNSQHHTFAVILAAGASTRLGRPKQLVQWGAETLLERAVRIAAEAGCAPLVVLGYASEQIASACDLSRCEVVINPAWRQGMGSSVRVGVEAASLLGAAVALVMTCDQPAVNVEHLRRLVELSKGAEIAASSYAGRNGVPAVFPASSFPALQALDGDSGARALLQHARSIELPFGELDVDTEESLQLARGLLHEKTGG